MSTPRTGDLPAGVDARTVRTPRGDFAAHDARPHGPARGHILAIPGFTGSKEDFTPTLPLLAADGWHATAYDQRGQYETPGADDADYSLAGFAADALAVSAALTGDATPDTAPEAARSHLVGHSFGGLVAQTALLASPQAWASLMLMCTGPAGFSIDRQVKPLHAFIGAVDTVGLEQIFEIQQNKRDPVPPEVRALLHTRFTTSSPTSLKAIAHHLVDAPDRIDDVAELDMPTFVVRGADDNEWPQQTQDEMARRLGVEVIVIPHSAHSPAVENPMATAHVVNDLIGGRP